MIATERFCRAPGLESWLEQRVLPEAMEVLLDTTARAVTPAATADAIEAGPAGPGVSPQ